MLIKLARRQNPPSPDPEKGFKTTHARHKTLWHIPDLVVGVHPDPQDIGHDLRVEERRKGLVGVSPPNSDVAPPLGELDLECELVGGEPLLWKPYRSENPTMRERRRRPEVPGLAPHHRTLKDDICREPLATLTVEYHPIRRAATASASPNIVAPPG